MSERPENLPALDLGRVNEIEGLLRHQSSVHFSSARAHESMWMLHAFAETALKAAQSDDRCAWCGDRIDDDDDGWRSAEDFGGTGTGGLSEALWCEGGPDHRHSPDPPRPPRDEATVKAEALQEAAADWDRADQDGSIGDFADKHYRAGQNLPSLWLHHRADALLNGSNS